MSQLLIATQNPGKVQEYQELLPADRIPGWEIIGLNDIGLNTLDVDETGTTFEENAILKARTYAQASGLLTLSDDSGLAVDALDGAPGIYSARYGGPGLDDAGRRAHLLRALTDVPDAQRTARFICVIALFDPHDEQVYTSYGKVEGRLLHEERGSDGFGYDPLFVPEGYSRTFAELTAEVKHANSHRGVAAQQVPAILTHLSRT